MLLDGHRLSARGIEQQAEAVLCVLGGHGFHAGPRAPRAPIVAKVATIYKCRFKCSTPISLAMLGGSAENEARTFSPEHLIGCDAVKTDTNASIRDLDLAS